MLRILLTQNLSNLKSTISFSSLTIEEKVAMCHAQSKFSSPGVERLGIPELWMSDGPHGVRGEIGIIGVTQDGQTIL
jgi:beta-glucosidase